MLNYGSQYVNSNWPKVSLSTSTYPLDQTYNNVCHRCHKQLAAFLLQQKVFCKPGSIRTLFLAEVLCFNMSQLFSLNKGLFDSLALTGCFSLLRFYDSASTLILQLWWLVMWAKYLHITHVARVPTKIGTQKYPTKTEDLQTGEDSHQSLTRPFGKIS